MSWPEGDFVQRLTAPFPDSEIRWTVSATKNKDTPRQQDLVTPYVTADTVRDRLNEVAGADGWSVDYQVAGPHALICRLTILGVTRSDLGEPGDQAQQKWKAAASDGLKRAAVQFGIGAYLHDKSLQRWQKPTAGPPRQGQQPVQGRSQARRPPPSAAPPSTPQPKPSDRFRDLCQEHSLSASRAATLLGALKGNSPDEAIRLYVKGLPGSEEQQWKQAADNLSAALADEVLA